MSGRWLVVTNLKNFEKGIDFIKEVCYNMDTVKRKEKRRNKYMKNLLHFWTKNYEIDLLAPIKEIVRDIKRLKKDIDKNRKK